MKFQYSLPKNEAFFRDYAGLAPTLSTLGYLAQVVSALTEFGVIYALIEASLKDFFPTAAPLAGLFGAIVGTAFIEVGLRKFVPYSVRAILYKRFAGLHLFVSCFIFTVTLALLGASGYLSFQGSKELVRLTAPQPQLASLAPVDSLAQEQREGALRQYSADSLAQEQRFAPALAATREKYSAQLAQQALALRNWENRERTEGRRYGSQKAQIKARIADIQATQAAELARLEDSRANALGAALEARNNALGGIATERAQQRRTLEEKNTQAEAHNAGQVERYGGGLAWFTVVCLIVLLLAVSIDEIHKMGSGIEEAALPNQYYFSQSVWGEFWEMVADKANYNLRAWIRRLAAATPQPPEPLETPALWDIPAQAIRRKGAAHIPADQPADQPGEEKYSSMFERLFSQNGTHGSQTPSNGKAADSTGRPVIQGFVRRDSLTDFVSTDNNTTPNLSTLVDIPATAGAVIEVDTAAKPCLHCGTMFRPNVTWQKFCSTPCREKFHEARHGKPFDPAKYRNKKAKA